MAQKRKPAKTPLPTPEFAVERYSLMDRVIREHTGQLDELESALGMYMIGHHFGWKILYMIHTKRTIRKYEEILRVKVVDVFPEFGLDADRTNAFKVIQAASNFWKAVSGEEKPPFDIDKRSMS